MTGLIDIHGHLLPGVDDGCADLAESIACAQALVGAGYAVACCTPHIWPSFPHNHPEQIARGTAMLQGEFDRAGIALRLVSGGEINLRPEVATWSLEQTPSYAMAGRWCIFDIWAEQLPPHFWPAVKNLQSHGLKLIIAHPERMRAVQADPDRLADELLAGGLLLQGNLQCISDPEGTPTRVTVEKFLRDGRYFALGSDTHKPETMACRLEGLLLARQIVGDAKVEELTVTNPRTILRESGAL